MVPTAFVRPSRNTIRMSFFRYSGFLMNRKRTVALSPVRRCSFVIQMMVAVWRTLPTWTATTNVTCSAAHILCTQTHLHNTPQQGFKVKTHAAITKQ